MWYTILIEMTLGNFSFAILIVGILQLITMLSNRPKAKLVKIESFLLDPRKITDIKLFFSCEKAIKDNLKKYYIEIYTIDEDNSYLVYGTNNFKKAQRNYKKTYKKIYRSL